MNLHSNAVKFTDAGGVVGLTCAGVGERVRVTVRDTGIGIAADQLERIFDPFVQARVGLTRPHEGTGLGPAISRDLARGMGGDVVVESELGVGTTFTVRLRRVVTTTGEPTDRRLASTGDGSGRRDGVERRSRQDRRTDDSTSVGA